VVASAVLMTVVTVIPVTVMTHREMKLEIHQILSQQIVSALMKENFLPND
jgi:hypothetical protein